MDRHDPTFWPSVLSHVTSGDSLPADDASEAMRGIMEGDATPAQVGGLLMALRTKGETVEEIEGFADVMLEFASPVATSAPLVDTCGTGGDRSGTFNISTIGAIVASGAGATVAKHGNRAATSHCGSADLLEALGVRIDLHASGVEQCLREAGIGFMFAPAFHPSTAYAVGIRRELRVPTVFNFLGPLTNPARPGAQVVGVSDARMLPLLAQVLARRGARAKVFRGADGLDELTTTGLSTVFEVDGGELRERTLDPSDLGFATAAPSDLLGGDVARNVEIARSVLAGDHGPPRDVVLLNAGAALEVAGVAPSIADGIATAAASIDEGRAATALRRWVEVSRAAGEDSG